VTSLRSAVQNLNRYPLDQTLDVTSVAQFMSMDRPVSVADLIRRLDQLPTSVPFQNEIVTGAALGGSVTLTLNNDGTYTFAGNMRATGLPSYAFRVVAVVRSGSGNVVVAAQHSGRGGAVEWASLARIRRSLRLPSQTNPVGSRMPTSDRVLQPGDDLRCGLRMVAIQRSSADDALD
jgi:hypothetical protein